jgi:hypothetical protein
VGSLHTFQRVSRFLSHGIRDHLVVDEPLRREEAGEDGAFTADAAGAVAVNEALVQV